MKRINITCILSKDMERGKEGKNIGVLEERKQDENSLHVRDRVATIALA